MQQSFNTIKKINFRVITILFFFITALNAQIPSDKLSAYYPFNGNAIDVSEHGNNAIYVSASLTYDRFGKDSSAYFFNGNDNYIDFGDILDDVFCKDTAQFTISGWAKTEVMGNIYGEGNVLIGKSAGGIGPYQWSVSHNSGMLFGCVFSDSTVINFQEQYMYMGSGEWFHFVMIFDGKQTTDSRIRVFVNNASDMRLWLGLGTLGTTTKNTSLHLFAGGQKHYQVLENRFNGYLDDIRIYDRVLTETEINALYHEGGWDTSNHVPIAKAGPDLTFFTDSLSTATVTLDGSESFDKDGDTLSYIWKEDSILLATGRNPIIRLPLGIHTITLFVSDGKGGLGVDQVIVSVNRQMKFTFSVYLGGPIYAGISVLGDNAIYAIANGDAVYRMNTSGDIVYSIRVGGSVRSSSSIAYDTTIYIASSDCNLYAFSKNGNSLWPPLPAGGELTATPTIDSTANRIYIGVSNHNFIAVNRLTGVVEWSYFADAPIRNSAVVTSDRKLVFATERGTIYGFDLNNITDPAEPTWQISLNSFPSAIALDNDGFIYIGTGYGNLLKIVMPTNQSASIVWQKQLEGAIVGSPVIDANGTLYIGSLYAKLYSIDIQSGDVKWIFDAQGSIYSTLAISDAGNIYIATDYGEVYCLDPDKNILWNYNLHETIEAPLLYYESTLFVGTLRNQVIGLYDGIEPLQSINQSKPLKLVSINKEPIWPTFQGNNQRTGSMISSSGSTNSKNISGNIPISYSLSQNFPNPFNPTTQIKYSIAKSGMVSLIVYDLLGREVATLVKEFKNAGNYTATLNFSQFNSGVFFYRLKSGLFEQTRKLLLIK